MDRLRTGMIDHGETAVKIMVAIANSRHAQHVMMIDTRAALAQDLGVRYGARSSIISGQKGRSTLRLKPSSIHEAWVPREESCIDGLSEGALPPHFQEGAIQILRAETSPATVSRIFHGLRRSIVRLGKS